MPSLENMEGFEEMSQIIDNIPQLQISIQQLSISLQNPNLPPQVRQATEMQLNQMQMELGQAMSVQAAMEAAKVMQQQFGGAMMQGMQATVGGNWTGMGNAGQFGNGIGQQGGQATQDGPYQRLPVNNRRRGLKRERPSDFLEVGGDGQGDGKTARYWE
jgi:protein MPE1